MSEQATQPLPRMVQLNLTEQQMLNIASMVNLAHAIVFSTVRPLPFGVFIANPNVVGDLTTMIACLTGSRTIDEAQALTEEEACKRISDSLTELRDMTVTGISTIPI